jgi:hypothetical protein
MHIYHFTLIFFLLVLVMRFHKANFERWDFGL